MATNKEIAGTIIDAYVRLRQSSEKIFISYGEMAILIGRGGQHALLGAPLDQVRDICADLGIPDIATMVVNMDALKSGALMPSGSAIEKHSGWPGLRKEQARAITFDWMSYKLR